jgi:hypothetical protein
VLVLVPARGVRHGEAANDDLVGLHVQDDAAVSLVFAPAADVVCFAEAGDVFWLAIDDGQPVEVAAVFRDDLRNKWRPRNPRTSPVTPRSTAQS